MHSTFNLKHNCLYTAQNSHMFRLYYNHHQTGYRNKMEIFTVLLIQKYYIVDGTENAAWGIALKIIFIYTFCFMCMCGLVSGSKRKI